jgi:hypothetical protein
MAAAIEGAGARQDQMVPPDASKVRQSPAISFKRGQKNLKTRLGASFLSRQRAHIAVCFAGFNFVRKE